MDGEHTVTYPPMADTHSLVKDWEESLLQNCSKERMQSIARQYTLPNATSLTKEPLYHAVFSHMLTIRFCFKCGGECDPMKHMFPPSKDPPTDSSPTALGRRTRSANATISPTHATTSGDISTITPVSYTHLTLPTKRIV